MLQTLNNKFSLKIVTNPRVIRLFKLSNIVEHRMKSILKRSFDKFGFILKHLSIIEHKIKRIMNKKK